MVKIHYRGNIFFISSADFVLKMKGMNKTFLFNIVNAIQFSLQSLQRFGFVEQLIYWVRGWGAEPFFTSSSLERGIVYLSWACIEVSQFFASSLTLFTSFNMKHELTISFNSYSIFLYGQNILIKFFGGYNIMIFFSWSMNQKLSMYQKKSMYTFKKLSSVKLSLKSQYFSN